MRTGDCVRTRDEGKRQWMVRIRDKDRRQTLGGRRYFECEREAVEVS